MTVGRSRSGEAGPDEALADASVVQHRASRGVDDSPCSPRVFNMSSPDSLPRSTLCGALGARRAGHFPTGHRFRTQDRRRRHRTCRGTDRFGELPDVGVPDGCARCNRAIRLIASRPMRLVCLATVRLPRTSPTRGDRKHGAPITRSLRGLSSQSLIPPPDRIGPEGLPESRRWNYCRGADADQHAVPLSSPARCRGRGLNIVGPRCRRSSGGDGRRVQADGLR